MADDNVGGKKNERKQKTDGKKRRQKMFNFAIILLISISLTLNGYSISKLETEDDNIDSMSTNSLIEFGILHGTHGCEEGGFSIQTGVDQNLNEILEEDEIIDIKNVCHGDEGNPGPMGNRGYRGYNGTDGANGTSGFNGTDGSSSFINSDTGEIGPCGDAVVIQMGNDSESQEVTSEVKMCFGQMFEGRITDITNLTGNSFTSGCSEGAMLNDLLIFAATSSGYCMLYSVDGREISQISPPINFLPGLNLGFTFYEDRIWFDAFDGAQTHIWSTDGVEIRREFTTFGIDNRHSLHSSEGVLTLFSENQITIISENNSTIAGSFTNLSISNDVMIYNSNGIILGGNNIGGELHSKVEFHDGIYYFHATSDNYGIELHSSNGFNLLRLSDSLSSISSNDLEPTYADGSIFFSSGELFAYNIDNSTSYSMNNDLQVAGNEVIVFEGRVWFPCYIANYGVEVCASNSLNATIVSDFANGFMSSNPKLFSAYENKLFAILEDENGGGVLCEITENSITEVYDHDTGALVSGNRGDLWFNDNYAYFIGDTTNHGTELFAWSHGTLTGDWIII